MRFAVLSDTHGDLSRMFAAADYIRALKPDALIHLGDFCADAEAMAKELRLELHAVAGNCDAGRTTRRTLLWMCWKWRARASCSATGIPMTWGRRRSG